MAPRSLLAAGAVVVALLASLLASARAELGKCATDYGALGIQPWGKSGGLANWPDAQSRWIWYTPLGQSPNNVAKPAYFFTVYNSASATSATLYWTADDVAELTINDQTLSSGGTVSEWATIKQASVSLRAGANVLQFRCGNTNVNNAANGNAGLLVSLKVGSAFVLRSQLAGWQYSFSPRNGTTLDTSLSSCAVSTPVPTRQPSQQPSRAPTAAPSPFPSKRPSAPTSAPSEAPSRAPSSRPSARPSREPTTGEPSSAPSRAPSDAPTRRPSETPSAAPTTAAPSAAPTAPTAPTTPTSLRPTRAPSQAPSQAPTPEQPADAPPAPGAGSSSNTVAVVAGAGGGLVLLVALGAALVVATRRRRALGASSPARVEGRDEQRHDERRYDERRRDSPNPRFKAAALGGSEPSLQAIGPAQVPELRRDFGNCTVKFPFKGIEADELTVTNGERLELLAQVDRDWAQCCNARGETGLVPNNVLVRDR
jgi:hypothetical protein